MNEQSELMGINVRALIGRIFVREDRQIDNSPGIFKIGRPSQTEIGIWLAQLISPCKFFGPQFYVDETCARATPKNILTVRIYARYSRARVDKHGKTLARGHVKEN